ncbi:MAG: CoA transferase [Chloroflexota bacterium]
MALPLADIRVVDFGTVLAGPFATMLLADQGADVIKLEPPGGESARRLAPNFPDSKGLSLGFLTFNRNKRTIELDITKPKGIEVAYRLFQWADVLVINMRLGTRQRRGLTYEHLAAINPRLIYASLTAFGEKGPDAGLPGVDITNQGRSGDIEARRPPGGSPPPHTHLYHFDMAVAMLIAYAVMLALRQRERTGQGQEIKFNLLQTALACQAIQMTRLVGFDGSYVILDPGPPRMYPGSDGRYVLVPGGGPQWAAFCRTIGLDHLATDPRFDTPEKRTQRDKELAEIISRQFATRPAREWEAMFKKNSLNATMVQRMDEVYDDPQVIANEMIIQFEQPGLGTVKAVNVPFKMSATAGEAWFQRHPPTVGEHTREVLQELGYSAAEIEALKSEGVIG